MKKYSTLIIILFSFILSSSLANAASQQFRVVTVEGDNAIVPNGATTASPVVENMSIHVGDDIVVGLQGRVELVAKDGTVIALEKKAHFSVGNSKEKTHVYYLHAGRFLADFPKSKTRQVKVYMRVAEVTIKGTQLGLIVQGEDGLESMVSEGFVRFRPPKNGPKQITDYWKKGVAIEANQGLIVRPLALPVKANQIPTTFINSLDWFKGVKKRIPDLLKQLEQFSSEDANGFRESTLKQASTWSIPRKTLRNIISGK